MEGSSRVSSKSIGWKCLFGGIICQNCDTLCNNQGEVLWVLANHKFRCCGWFDIVGNRLVNGQSTSQNKSILRIHHLDDDEAVIGKSGVYGNFHTRNVQQSRNGLSVNWWVMVWETTMILLIESSPCGEGTITFTPPCWFTGILACCPCCCIKIPLIPLKCDEEGIDDSVTILSSSFWSYRL